MKPTSLFSYRKHWAAKFGPAPFLPMSRAEMDELGWDSCDVIILTGDAYVDHPSFGMAVIGRVLEAQGFRVGIIAQPDWNSVVDFQRLGRPNLFFGVTGGNMDSMVNRYTSERRLRSDDAYTPDGEGGKRPDRAVLVYSQRCREAYRDVPVVIGGIEASLRRLAHYDYWSDRVRRSLLLDAKADILLYGNAERAVVELAHRLAGGEPIAEIGDLRGSVVIRKGIPEDWRLVDVGGLSLPRQETGSGGCRSAFRPMVGAAVGLKPDLQTNASGLDMAGGYPVTRHREKEVVRLPSYEQVRDDPLLYAQASRLFHLESNPGNARALVQRHGDREVWVNPPPIPLTTPELDGVFDLPYQRVPHPAYGGRRLPAYEMIRFSINIMRGCFGGCTFCSITEHEGRIIQNRSEGSILREIETLRDTVPGFTGHVSDLGGPTANMWRLHCREPAVESNCRRLSCVYPVICKNLNIDHRPLIRLYRKARELKGIKKIFIASGVRYDLAVESPEYVKELVSHHVGGYLKIAPEHTEPGPLALMMKPGIGVFDRFKRLFEKYSKEAGKEQYLIPYFIAAHPGTSDQDMLHLALWLKENGFRPDQVQAFLPSPMALATAMYHSGRNPLKQVRQDAERVFVPSGGRQRRLHKAFLRYHDPENWPLLREALKHMGRADLIGNGKKHLIPAWQPQGTGERPEGARTQATTPRSAGRRPGCKNRKGK